MRKSVLVVALLVLAGQASAAGLDFTSITSAVDVSTVAAAIVAMGALKVGPNVAKWAANKLASFFR